MWDILKLIGLISLAICGLYIVVRESCWLIGNHRDKKRILYTKDFWVRHHKHMEYELKLNRQIIELVNDYITPGILAMYSTWRTGATVSRREPDLTSRRPKVANITRLVGMITEAVGTILRAELGSELKPTDIGAEVKENNTDRPGLFLRIFKHKDGKGCSSSNYCKIETMPDGDKALWVPFRLKRLAKIGLTVVCNGNGNFVIKPKD